MARKIAEIPQPMYVMKVRMVLWTRLVIGCLERSFMKEMPPKSVIILISNITKHDNIHDKMHFDDLTSRMAKLVKWLQPQIVSLSVLFWTEQPFELQPPDPSVGRKQK